MLVFLSSAARLQYAEDVLRALSRPKRTWLRFRYDLSLVEGYSSDLDHGGLVKKIFDGQLEAQTDGLIAFLDAHEKRKQPSVVPCRTCQVTLEAFDPILVCHLKLGDFCTTDVETVTRAFSVSAPSLMPSWSEQNGEPRLEGSWVFEADIPGVKNDAGYSFKYFAKVCGELTPRYPFFAGTEGENASTDEDSLNPLWHVSVFDADVKARAQRSVKGHDLSDGLMPENDKFVLDGNKNHTLRVFHYYPSSGRRKKDFSRCLNVKLHEVSESQDFADQTSIKSEYNVLDLGFRTILSPFRKYGFARVSISDSSEERARRFSEIEVPFEVKPNYRHTFWNVVLISQGFIVPAMIAASFRSGFSLLSAQAFFIVLAGLIAGRVAVFGLKRSL